MSEDVKPRRFEIFYSGLVNTFSVRDNFHAYIMARKQENMDDEYIRLIELEPTMRMMDELAEAISNWKKQVETYGGDYLPGNYNQLSNSLEKYKKFKEGLR